MSLHKKLNLIYPSVPFFWDYYDMANLIKVRQMMKITKEDFIKKTRNKNKKLIDLINKTDKADYYILYQEARTNNNIDDEIYISYHTYLLDKINKTKTIDEIDQRYEIETGVFKLTDNIKTSNTYPSIVLLKGKEIEYKLQGISIDNISPREISIHKVNDIIKFSPSNVCNIKIKPRERIELVSYMKEKNTDIKVFTINILDYNINDI